MTALLHAIDAALVACEAAIRSARLTVAAAASLGAPVPEPAGCPRCGGQDLAAAGDVTVCGGCRANFKGREVIGG